MSNYVVADACGVRSAGAPPQLISPRLAAAALVLLLCATPAMAQTWFQIGQQTNLPAQGTDPQKSYRLQTGELVIFYDAWGYPVQSEGRDSVNTFQPGPPPQGRRAELMVEVLANCRTTDNFIVRLITTQVTDSARYLRWNLPGTAGDGQPLLQDDPSVDPMNRGKDDLHDAYAMRLEKLPDDSNRFYVSFLPSSKSCDDGRARTGPRTETGTKYYLRSDQTDDPAVHRLSLTPAQRRGGATQPPPAQVGASGSRLGRHDFFFDRLSPGGVTDVLTSQPRPVGRPEQVASSIDFVPGVATDWTVNNLDPQTPRLQPVLTKTASTSTTESYEFHWDVGITVGAEANVGVAKFSVSVTTTVGGNNANSKTTSEQAQIVIPEVTVPPCSTVTASAKLTTTTLTQPVEMQLRRQVQSRNARSPDEYVMKIVGDVTHSSQHIEVNGWGRPRPLPEAACA